MVKSAPRQRPGFRCEDCGATVPKWVGRCPECQAWGTVTETGGPRLQAVAPGAVTAPARPIAEVDAEAAQTRSTGVEELDRVLGGGLVPGGVVLLSGEPGVGKSTLLLEAASRWTADGARSLVVSGEESAAQVRLRAGRIGALSPQLFLAAETDVAAVLGHVEKVQPSLLVVDSVQTMTVAGVDGAAGGVAQVREVAAALIRTAKERGIATVLVGHVTKDGSIAGPRTLEHLVDVVLSFEGDRHSRLRLARAVKNRFGPTDEVGCFDLTDDGIWSMPDPSGLFLTHRDAPVAGTSVTITLEGRRPLPVEMQALLVGTQAATPRRVAHGLDAARVAMLLAVLERRGGLKVTDSEVYAATVGGVRVGEPAADLALVLAVASAKTDRPLPPGLVAVGELGLGGEVRAVTGLDRRLAEAARLGFRHALVPRGAARVPDGLAVLEVDSLPAALAALR